ncbi:hypothetical protein B0H14DRAFT_2636749 [Mycena olivaceomarginata]|nr:hypothetical protein B0H14DRAFT_2636749 [Mycena olivaceomarginata]
MAGHLGPPLPSPYVTPSPHQKRHFLDFHFLHFGQPSPLWACATHFMAGGSIALLFTTHAGVHGSGFNAHTQLVFPIHHGFPGFSLPKSCCLSTSFVQPLLNDRLRGDTSMPFNTTLTHKYVSAQQSEIRPSTSSPSLHSSTFRPITSHLAVSASRGILFCVQNRAMQSILPMITRYFIETFGWGAGTDCGELERAACFGHLRTDVYYTLGNRWPDGTDAWEASDPVPPANGVAMIASIRLREKVTGMQGLVLNFVQECSVTRVITKEGVVGANVNMCGCEVLVAEEKNSGLARMNADTCVSTICTRGQVWVKSRSSFTAAQTVHILPPTQRATIVAPFKSAKHVFGTCTARTNANIAYCYVCIRLHLEVDWTCPHLNCNRTIRKAPKIDNAEARTVAADYPDRVDKSQSCLRVPSMMQDNPNLKPLLSTHTQYCYESCVGPPPFAKLLLVYCQHQMCNGHQAPKQRQGRRRPPLNAPPRPNLHVHQPHFAQVVSFSANGRSVTAPAHTLQMHPNRISRPNAAVESVDFSYDLDDTALVGEVQELGSDGIILKSRRKVYQNSDVPMLTWRTPGQIPG